MIIAQGTDIGNVRTVNEDSYGVYKLDDNCFCAVVADGMGGHKGGQTASKLAVKTIINYVSKNLQKCIDNPGLSNDILTEAICKANEKIHIQALSNDELYGMGTTVVCVICVGGMAYVANVGDSRLYKIDTAITQITKDHSFVQNLLDEGVITYEEAKEHPNKNVITRAVGTELNIEIDLFEFTIDSSTKILLCTDGLTNFVSDETIENLLLNYTPWEANDELIKCANANGGKDNITVVNIDFNEVTK